MKLTKLANSLVAISAMILAAGATLNAQTSPGRAEVRAIKGTAYYSPSAGAPMEPLKVRQVLGPGATVKTGPGSIVDLFLGNSAGVLRMIENTTLALDKLTLTDTGADTVVEVQLNVPEGTILGNVQKLATASKYEIKVPNGVAGIRGTEYRISAGGYIVLLHGTLIFVYVAPGGNPVPYTLQAPPPVYFSPIEGVKPAPEELVREVRRQWVDFRAEREKLGPESPPSPGTKAPQDPALPANKNIYEPPR